MAERGAILNGKEIIAAARETGHEIILGNPELPIAAYLREIGDSIEQNTFTIIISETGSGKTTQVPQVMFGRGKTIDHTQPRRSAAHMMANRIRDELLLSIPGLAPDTVAIHTGEECTIGPNTQITLQTDGTLLAVNYNPERNRLEMPHDGHVTIIDEVHEANKNIEVALALLMQEAQRNPDVRVVLMTATANKDFLVDRISEITNIVPNVIEVPGRTYPLEWIEEPELTAASSAVKYLQQVEDGLIVRVSGIGEIKDVIKEVERTLPKSLAGKVEYFMAHSSMSSEYLRRAYEYIPPEGRRKLIVGTNILSTSVTIKGITGAIDSGQKRQKHLNKRGYEGLYVVDSPQSDIVQLGGRASRVKPGFAVLTRANERATYVPLADRRQYEVPEILRLELRSELLRLACLGIDLEGLPLINEHQGGDSTAQADAREKLQASIRAAKHSLYVLGALNDQDNVTPIGIEMNRYPVNAMLKRVIVESLGYSIEVQTQVAAMAAAIENGGLPMYGRFANNDWKEITSEKSSDLLMQLDLFIEALTMSKEEQARMGLNPKSMEAAIKTYEKIIGHLGLERGATLARPNELQREEILKCIYTGYVESIFVRHGHNRYRQIGDEHNVEFQLSDRSAVDPRAAMCVIGLRYAVERMKRGESKEVSVIESVTVIDSFACLGEAAARMCDMTRETVFRNGQAFERTEQFILGRRTGNTTERVATADDMDRMTKSLVEKVLSDPGDAQKELRGIKKRLEQLNHLSQEPVRCMKQTDLIEFVKMAVAQARVPNSHHIDNALRVIIQEHNITIRTYLSEDDERRIIANAPEVIEYNGRTFALDYRMGVPKVKHFAVDDVSSLTSNIYLPDGREVKFVYSKREYSALDLNALLATQ